ncbi:alpha-hydroxy acid oxidase [Kocuria sp. TGY1127_2]|uniref:alpha-hydroxy acid oxidase n=1 Tax=Kocuria sp. TGY1127_2 TaxID=2711328 RepID=UPI0018D65AD9
MSMKSATKNRLAPLTRQFPDRQMLKDFIKLEGLRVDRRAHRLERAQDIWDLREIARRRTPKGPFDYVDGAAERELSLGRARRTYDDLVFHPQVLRDVSDVSLATTVCGSEASMPLAIAPTGFTRMMHSEGEIAGVRAAHAAGIPFSLSTMGTETIERVAEAGQDGRTWFQLYLWKEDRDTSFSLVDRAAQAGFDTLLVTVDTPVAGARHRDARNGMSFPPRLTPKTFLNASYRPEWWINFLTTAPLGFTNFGGTPSHSLATIGDMFDPSLDISELRWLRSQWNGHLIVKGIQTPEDAERAVEAGADGIVLSNHGGRQLDRAPVPLLMLPKVRQRLGEDATILIDTGIMSGADVVAAVALGADAALIGRAYLYGLMAGGAEGVERGLSIFRNEMQRTLQLMGIPDINSVGPDHVGMHWRTL